MLDLMAAPRNLILEHSVHGRDVADTCCHRDSIPATAFQGFTGPEEFLQHMGCPRIRGTFRGILGDYIGLRVYYLSGGVLK